MDNLVHFDVFFVRFVIKFPFFIENNVVQADLGPWTAARLSKGCENQISNAVLHGTSCAASSEHPTSENILGQYVTQLMRFNVCFHKILIIMAILYRGNDIIAARMVRGVEGPEVCRAISFKSPFLTAKLEM